MAKKSAKPAEVHDQTPTHSGAKTTPVRLSDEAIKWARIASGYTGESMAEYVSRIVATTAKADAERLHAEALGGQSK